MEFSCADGPARPITHSKDNSSQPLNSLSLISSKQKWISFSLICLFSFSFYARIYYNSKSYLPAYCYNTYFISSISFNQPMKSKRKTIMKWNGIVVLLCGSVGLMNEWVMSAERPSAAEEYAPLISLFIQSISLLFFAFIPVLGCSAKRKTSSRIKLYSSFFLINKLKEEWMREKMG